VTADRVVVGAVGKPFGVRGDVYVHPDPDLDHDFPAGQVYETDRGTLRCAASRLHSGRRVVRFEQASDREAAEALRGTVLTVPRDEVPLEEGAFWVSDLEGAEVVDPNGDVVGVVEAVQDGLAHDLLVVARPDGGEVLIPVVDEFVEVTEDGIVVRPIPGLLDLSEADDV
jgi:16S rRNA processing protein RimM